MSIRDWDHDVEARRLALAISNDPEDAGLYAVYGDWLHRLEDPRGELIALQLAADQGLVAPSVARAFLDEHAARFVGPLATLLSVERDPLMWRGGFVRRASLYQAAHVLVEELSLLLQHESGRFLVELAVEAGAPTLDPRPQSYWDGRQYIVISPGDDLQDLVDGIAAHAPITLRVLRLAAPYQRFGDLSRLWPAIGKVRELALHGGVYSLGQIELPGVERVELELTDLLHDFAISVADARWPRLRELSIDAGLRYTCSEPLVALFARDDVMANLTHLGLRGGTLTDPVLFALERSVLHERLSSLDLRRTELSSVAVARLAGWARGMHLQLLDVSGCGLVSSDIELLEASVELVIR